MLARTGGGSWQPDRSTRDWVRFNLYGPTAELLRIRQEVLGEREPLRDPYGAGEQLEISGVLGSAER